MAHLPGPMGKALKLRHRESALKTFMTQICDIFVYLFSTQHKAHKAAQII